MAFNPISVAEALVNLVKKDYPQFSAGQEPTIGEVELAKEVLKSFSSILTDYAFEEETVLECEPDSEGSSYSQSLVDESGGAIQEKYADIVPVERKRAILKILAIHPSWSASTVQKNGGKEYKHDYYKNRWEDHVKRGGTVFEKYSYIDQYVFEKFEEARKEFKFVKERDLQMWGIQAAQSFRDPTFSFKASPTWTRDFKLRHGISSRKVTKLVTRRDIATMDTIMESAKKFQDGFRRISSNFRDDLIFNTDQVGFTYEITGNRTLSFKGEKDTLGVAKSPTNLATHSYTVQYVINKAGKIVGDVFLCLQQRTGRLGPKVQENLFPAADVTVTCSTSGKLTTSLYEYFLDNVIITSVKEDFLLMIDSWPGQTNISSYADRFGKNGVPKCTLEIIPKKCTSICQPLDTTFHRQLKYFARAICWEASLRYSKDVHPTDEITTTNNIIRLHSLLRNQLGSDRFVPMILYSWYSSGLTDEKPTFLTVKDICFTFEKRDGALCDFNCQNTRFLKCAHCRKVLCFECFFYGYHRH